MRFVPYNYLPTRCTTNDPIFALAFHQDFLRQRAARISTYMVFERKEVNLPDKVSYHLRLFLHIMQTVELLTELERQDQGPSVALSNGDANDAEVVIYTAPKVPSAE
jgi:hypothetical protein